MLDALNTIKFFKLAPIEDADMILEIVTDLVRGRHTPVSRVTAHSVPGQEPQPGKNNSIRSKALRVLREHGSPMGGAELRDAINERFSSTHSKASVVGEVARLVRLGDTFTRPRPGQYGLLEWRAVELPHDRQTNHTPKNEGA